MYSVLVVDDDDSIVLFMSRLLKNKFDCKVFRAENGLEALSILEDDPIDLMFLDITMPIMDGIETLKALRSDKRFKDLPVIILSAIAERDTINEVMDYGIYSFLLKPLMYDSALKSIKNLFEKIKVERNKSSVLDEIEAEEEKQRAKILIVDPDNEFKDEFRIKLSDRFLIFDSDSGAKGLNIFIKEKPQFVFLAENLPLLSEDVVAKKIKSMQINLKTVGINDNNNDSPDVLVYLMQNNEPEDNETSHELMELFDDILYKTEEEGILLKGMNKALKF